MANVVIGDLSKYNGDDVLKTYGIGDLFKIPRIDKNINLSISFDFYFDSTLFSDEFIECRNGTSGGWVFRSFSLGFIQFDSWGSNGFDRIEKAIPTGWHNITIFYDSGVKKLIIDDVEYSNTINIGDNNNTDFITFGGGLNSNGAMEISNIVYKDASSIEYIYIKNGDFGSPVLIDHSGNGNDGTINGATWWKKGVDEVYATPDLYKSTLVSPLTEDQNVTYTDGTPFYDSNDPFWNPYNQDISYSFMVSKGIFNYGDSFDFDFQFKF